MNISGLEFGKFENCGHKFGRWYHMVWMEKIIGEHKEIREFIKFEEMEYKF